MDQQVSALLDELGQAPRVAGLVPADYQPVARQVRPGSPSRQVVETQAEAPQGRAVLGRAAQQRGLARPRAVLGQVAEQVEEDLPGDRLGAELLDELHLGEDDAAVARRTFHQRAVVQPGRRTGDDDRHGPAARRTDRLARGHQVVAPPELEVLGLDARQRRVSGPRRKGHRRPVVAQGHVEQPGRIGLLGEHQDASAAGEELVQPGPLRRHAPDHRHRLLAWRQRAGPDDQHVDRIGNGRQRRHVGRRQSDRLDGLARDALGVEQAHARRVHPELLAPREHRQLVRLLEDRLPVAEQGDLPRGGRALWNLGHGQHHFEHPVIGRAKLQTLLALADHAKTRGALSLWERVRVRGFPRFRETALTPALSHGEREPFWMGPKRPPQRQLRSLRQVVEHLHAAFDRLAGEEPPVVVVAVRGDRPVGELVGLVQGIRFVQRPALDDRPRRDAPDLEVPVAEDLHLPALGLGQVAVAAVVQVGLVAEEDRVPRRVAGGNPEELADVERLFLVPEEFLASTVEHAHAELLRLGQPPRLVGPAGVLGVLVRVVDADHVGHAAGVAVRFVEDRAGRVPLLDEAAHPGQVGLGRRGVVHAPAVELVLQAPHHDRRPVLVAVDHGLEVPGVILPKDGIAHAVDVVVVPDGPLDDHQQAQLIGHVVVDAAPGLGVRAEGHAAAPLDRLPALADFFAGHRGVRRPPARGQQVDLLAVEIEPVPLGPKLAEPEPRALGVAGR